MIKIIPILALKDNYIWAIINPTTKQTAVVDPGVATPVLKYLKSEDLNLTSILLTHHHADHIGGVPELLEHFSVPVYGPRSKYITTVTNYVTENSQINLPEYALTLHIMEIPGHTLDHIAYFNSNILFCGDTLFTGGCGRIFEGTPEQMLTSLLRLSNLSDQTKVYCGHEYTVNNLKFALQVEPNNVNLVSRLKNAEDLISKGLPTVPSTMQEEQLTNPFLRIDQPEVIANVQRHLQVPESNDLNVFSALRTWKNSFPA